MSLVDRAEGSDDPDFTGAKNETLMLKKIISDNVSKDFNYFL